MNKLVMMTAATLFSSIAISAAGQVKTVEGKTETTTVSVEAIDSARRQVTVKKPDGNYESFYVPQDIKKFDTLKVGDKITARYYENIILNVAAPGAAPRNDESVAVTPTATGTAGTAAHQRTVTVTITAIDMNTPSVTFTGPNRWKYSTKVKDKAALSKVKVGDNVDITWTEALVLSID